MTEHWARFARILVCASLLGMVGCTSSPSTTNSAPPTAKDPIPACAPEQLVLSTSEISPGATHRGMQVDLGLAAGTGACAVSGYPEIETVDGGPVIRAAHTPRGYLGGLPPDRDVPPMVVLNGGAAAGAWATVEGVAVDPGGNPCPTYDGLRVTLPNSPAPQPVAATITACALEVHPILGTEMH